MKAISAGLEAHLALPVTTLATLWKITRRDAQVFGFTDHDRDLVFDGLTYEAAIGYTSGEIRSSAELSVDNVEATGVLDSSSITEGDLLAGRWDFAVVEMRLVNYANLGDGALLLRKGRIGEVSLRRDTYTAELRGLMQHMQQSVGEVYSPACRADLGDARCGVNLAAITVTGTLTAVTDRRTFTDSGRAEAVDYFNGGLMTWTGGANNGLQMEVKDFGSGTFTLTQAMPYTVQVGDTYSVYPGCGKRLLEDCRDKFSNLVNFRGEPYVPGLDSLFRGPV